MCLRVKTGTFILWKKDSVEIFKVLGVPAEYLRRQEKLARKSFLGFEKG